ncbi:MAG: HAMP domain-containing protein, partial [Thermodesulfobacteriota bacterium]
MRFSRPKSIRHRFFIGTALVITTALLMFSAVRIYFEARSQHVDLEWQADYLLDISAQSLSSALWQYNEQYVDDYIDALFQFQNVVHVLVSDDQFKVKSRTRDGFKGKGFGTDRQPPGFISRQAEIEYSNVVVGKVDIILSTDHLRQEIINSSFTTIIRMLLIIGLIFFTIYYLSHKYIFTPLTRLERSAQLIGQGNLDAPIDTGENDEIGHLASTFEKMIQSIKAITASRDELDHEIQERKRTEAVLSDTLELLQTAESIGKS